MKAFVSPAENASPAKEKPAKKGKGKPSGTAMVRFSVSSVILRLLVDQRTHRDKTVRAEKFFSSTIYCQKWVEISTLSVGETPKSGQKSRPNLALRFLGTQASLDVLQASDDEFAGLSDEEKKKKKQAARGKRKSDEEDYSEEEDEEEEDVSEEEVRTANRVVLLAFLQKGCHLNVFQYNCGRRKASLLKSW